MLLARSQVDIRLCSQNRQQRAVCAAGRQRRLVVQVAAEAFQSEEDKTQEILQNCTRRIRDLGRQGKVREAIKELAGLAQVGVQPDVPAATALVKACTGRGDMNLAHNVFDELFGDFLDPDEVAFTVLLRGHGAKTPPDWSRIDATLTMMRQQYDMLPTATSFNCLLESCVRTNDLDRAMDVIDRMADDGVVPDEFTEAIVSRKRTLRSYFKKQLGKGSPMYI